jgi:ribosome recycling factor
MNAYGSRVSLKQTANIAVEDARTLRVAPYDASLVKEVERAISAADLGVGISSDATGVRTTFPELTSDRRQELLKIAKQKLEEARTTVRLARDEVWSDIQKKEREGEITEDDKFTLKDELQKHVDAANEMLEKHYQQKEKEITS